MTLSGGFFINRCLWRIVNVRWLDWVAEKNWPWPVLDQLRRRTGWLKNSDSTAEHCKAVGRSGRPKSTWQRDVEKEMWTHTARGRLRQQHRTELDEASGLRPVTAHSEAWLCVYALYKSTFDWLIDWLIDWLDSWIGYIIVIVTYLLNTSYTILLNLQRVTGD